MLCCSAVTSGDQPLYAHGALGGSPAAAASSQFVVVSAEVDHDGEELFELCAGACRPCKWMRERGESAKSDLGKMD